MTAPAADGSHRNAVDLADRVRAALHTGALPLAANSAYGGRGRGEVCAVCGLTIALQDILYEVQEPSRNQAHLECYQVWLAESRRFREIRPSGAV